MFKFVLKKGLYNLVINAYESHFHIYQKEIDSIIPSLTDTTSEEEMQHLDNIATQKYYSAVFDCVCQEVSNNVPRFKMLLPLKLASYNFDPDSLKPWDIYGFVFWCLYSKNSDIENHRSIYNFVYELKKDFLLSIDR